MGTRPMQGREEKCCMGGFGKRRSMPGAVEGVWFAGDDGGGQGGARAWLRVEMAVDGGARWQHRRLNGGDERGVADRGRGCMAVVVGEKEID